MPRLIQILHDQPCNVLDFISRISIASQYYMSREIQKYSQLSCALEATHLEDNYAQSAAFFFKSIQHLDADILLNQIQIAEQQRQIRTLEEKLGLIKQQQRIFDNERQAQQSSEEVIKDFSCPHKDCLKRFQKQSGVKLHALLMHSSPRPKERGIFKLELMPEDSLA